MSLTVGFIGALLGGKLSQLLDLPEPFPLEIGGRGMPLLWSIIGGALFVATPAPPGRAGRSLNFYHGKRRLWHFANRTKERATSRAPAIAHP